MNKKLEIKSDERGNFVEVFKIPGFGQVSYSTTKSGIVRGNHYHTRKKEIFCVIEGEAKIRQRNIKTNEIEEVVVSGDAPELVEMKLNWTHNIQNIGDTEMKLLIWISEVYNPNDPDTFMENI
ncbi:hypothetical protein COY06_05665 [Candidatus Peregrinibacteria bacterium CG_4_10_14_0_2_um_filter_41_8]|nr:MAG: hypothetical protein COY06_05665 [Candidatus Peregrinibacteria bacterium CG_4_10_14_0_2_um_filter_41_8]